MTQEAHFTRGDYNELRQAVASVDSKVTEMQIKQAGQDYLIRKIADIDRTVNGDNGPTPNGHTHQLANHEARISVLEGNNLTWKRVLWQMFGPVLALVGIGVAVLVAKMIVEAFAKAGTP